MKLAFKSSACIILGAITMGCLSQGVSEIKTVPSESQLTTFVKTIESRPNAITHRDEVRNEALANGIADQISMETWRRLLEESTKSGLKSRIAIQLHPIHQQREYFDEMVHLLGYDSDVFTRCRILGFMIESYPNDPRTPIRSRLSRRNDLPLPGPRQRSAGAVWRRRGLRGVRTVGD